MSEDPGARGGREVLVGAGEGHPVPFREPDLSEISGVGRLEAAHLLADVFTAIEEYE